MRIDRSSSSRVVAPSASAEIVRVATRIGSTPSRPSEARAIALTILLTSTGSSAPLRFLTRMPPAVGCPPDGGAGAFAVSVSVGAAPARSADSAAVSVVAALSSITVTVGSPARSLRRRRVVGIVWKRSRNRCRPPDVVVVAPIGTTCRGNGSVITAVKLRVCQPSRRETVNLPGQWASLSCAQRPDRRTRHARRTSASSAWRRSFAHTSSTDSAVAWTKSTPSRLRTAREPASRSASACQISSTCNRRPSRPRTLFSRNSRVVLHPARSSSRRSACCRIAPCWR